MYLQFVLFAILLLIERTFSEGLTAIQQKRVKFRQGLTRFSSEFTNVCLENISDNVAFSPLLAASMLGILKFGARGQTKEKIHSTVGLLHDESANLRFLKLISLGLNRNHGLDTQIYNKMLIKNDVTVDPKFEQIANVFFDSKIERFDAENPKRAIDAVNLEFQNATKNHLKFFAAQNDFNKPFDMMLMNGVHFRGKWMVKFNPQYTIADLFYSIDKSISTVPMMFVKSMSNYDFLESYKSDYIEIPYQSSNKYESLSLFVIQPRNLTHFGSLKKNFVNINFSKLVNNPKKKVFIHLPKFKVTSKINLLPVLHKMKAKNIFDGADFSGISRKPGLSLGKMYQKVVFEVTEQGKPDPAEVTYIPNEHFVVNKSFVFVVVQKITGIPLFYGQYIKPSEEQSARYQRFLESINVK